MSLSPSSSEVNNAPGPAEARLRVGLLVDSLTQPRWVRRIIEDIQASTIAEVALVVENGKAPAENVSRGRARSAWENRERLLYALYTKFDESRVRVSPDAFARDSIGPLVAGCPVLRVEPLMKKYSDYFREEDVAEILKYDLDVALRFGFRILKGKALSVARWGVWSYHHGDNLVNRGGPPGFWEVMRGEPVTGSVLQVLTEDLDGGRALYRSWAPTLSSFSVKRNKNNYYWKSSAFVMRKLRELRERGEPVPADGPPGASPYRPYFDRLYKSPTNSEMLPLLAGLCGRFAVRKLARLPYTEQWWLAYDISASDDRPPGPLYRFKHLVPPPDRFWADPFPVKADGGNFIFFEEYPYREGKGGISVLRVDEGGVVEGPAKVLERDYHLSYPFIFEWRGARYMIPETAANSTVELYRCASFPDRWELESVLLEGVRAADATLYEGGGLWWMFVNIAEEGVARNWDELHLFYAETPLGPWAPHRRNPVKSDARSARPAGRLFRWNGDLYRPAQDCSKGYGHAVSLNRVVRLDAEEYREEEVWKILPRWRNDVVGTHTLNREQNLTVVDCLVRRRRAFRGR
jgi:hypothetical protein